MRERERRHLCKWPIACHCPILYTHHHHRYRHHHQQHNQLKNEKQLMINALHLHYQSWVIKKQRKITKKIQKKKQFKKKSKLSLINNLFPYWKIFPISIPNKNKLLMTLILMMNSNRNLLWGTISSAKLKNILKMRRRMKKKVLKFNRNTKLMFMECPKLMQNFRMK